MYCFLSLEKEGRNPPLLIEIDKEKEEPPKLELKPLPTELKYAYLEEGDQCTVVISSSLNASQEGKLLGLLSSHLHGGRSQTGVATTETIESPNVRGSTRCSSKIVIGWHYLPHFRQSLGEPYSGRGYKVGGDYCTE